MNILITGGAGYIGSHTALLFKKAGHSVFILDDLSSGNKWAIPEGVTFYEGSTSDKALLKKIFTGNKIDGVIHFAAFIEVEESTKNPLKYFKNNTVNAITLLEKCVEHGVNKFIFSSTAAVYGEPKTTPILECSQLSPINPYGNSKFCTELILQDLANSFDQNSAPEERFRYAALRYFNVAGANEGGKIGQVSKKSTHLIKIASEVASNKRKGMAIFGSDYSTPDGTCVRDYIHVDDLAQAHLDALEYLNNGNESDVFNIGYGKGSSVKEVIQTMKSVSKKDFLVEILGRRAGDPAELIASSKKAKEVLGWKPKYDDLEYICKTAYEWEKTLNK